MRLELLSLALVSLAACATTKHEPSAASAHQFERLKSLEGEWVVVGGPSEPGAKTIQYRVIGNGSALVESMFPGTPEEMLTVYHQDGGKLALTHYCTLGNQPRMVAEPSDDPDTISFRFDGGSSLDAAHDQHMHSLRVHFVDDAHVSTEWTLYGGGKPIEVAKFALVRSWR